MTIKLVLEFFLEIFLVLKCVKGPYQSQIIEKLPSNEKAFEVPWISLGQKSGKLKKLNELKTTNSFFIWSKS